MKLFDLGGTESPINDDYHTRQKKNLLAELIRIERLDDYKAKLGVVEIWKRELNIS
jgi:hypothetical protein